MLDFFGSGYDVAEWLGLLPLSLRRPEGLDGAGWGLLRSFFDVLRARGGRIVLDFGSESVVVVRDLPHLMRLLAPTPDRGLIEPGFSAPE